MILLLHLFVMTRSQLTESKVSFSDFTRAGQRQLLRTQAYRTGHEDPREDCQ